MDPVLEQARSRLLARFGDDAKRWWDGLPSRLASLTARWELDLGDPVPRGHTSLVLNCRVAGGRAAVLKLTPDTAVAAAEARALRMWAGSGYVPELWASDEGVGALLLEAVVPGVPLADPAARAAVDELAKLIAALHAEGRADGAQPLRERVEFIFDLLTPRVAEHPLMSASVSQELLERGRELALTLADGGGAALLHGDLHPGNVLDGGRERGLVAIDPRPCVGDPAFDAVDWVVWRSSDPREWESRSAHLADALRADRDRLMNWCKAFAAIMAAGRVARAGGATAEAEALLSLASA